MPTTPNIKMVTPSLDDIPDVPRDLQVIADHLDTKGVGIDADNLGGVTLPDTGAPLSLYGAGRPDTENIQAPTGSTYTCTDPDDTLGGNNFGARRWTYTPDGWRVSEGETPRWVHNYFYVWLTAECMNLQTWGVNPTTGPSHEAYWSRDFLSQSFTVLTNDGSGSVNGVGVFYVEPTIQAILQALTGGPATGGFQVRVLMGGQTYTGVRQWPTAFPTTGVARLSPEHLAELRELVEAAESPDHPQHDQLQQLKSKLEALQVEAGE